jgi:hypothetical protein
MAHAAREEELGSRGRELTRQLFQDHLDLRAAREERLEEVAGADGVARTRAEPGHTRALATVFGVVTVTRIAYRVPGAANLYPVDAALNLPAGKHSHGLRKLAASEAARGSFEATGQAIGQVTGTGLGKRQAEQLARAAAADVDAFTRPASPAQPTMRCWECAAYLTAKAPHLGYATALRQGWPIATASSREPAGTSSRTGWTSQAPGGVGRRRGHPQAPRPARHGDFAEYWPFHLRQEHQRIHQARYRHRHGLTLAA